MSETTYTGTGKKPGLGMAHDETTTGVSGVPSADKLIADLRAELADIRIKYDLAYQAYETANFELAAARAEIERLRTQWGNLLVEIGDLTDELPLGKESLEDVVAAVKLMRDQRDAAVENGGLYWAEIERLMAVVQKFVNIGEIWAAEGTLSETEAEIFYAAQEALEGGAR